MKYIGQIKTLCKVSRWQIIMSWQRHSKWSGQFQTEPGVSLLSSYILQHSSLASLVPENTSSLFVSSLALFLLSSPLEFRLLSGSPVFNNSPLTLHFILTTTSFLYSTSQTLRVFYLITISTSYLPRPPCFS